MCGGIRQRAKCSWRHSNYDESNIEGVQVSLGIDGSVCFAGISSVQHLFSVNVLQMVLYFN